MKRRPPENLRVHGLSEMTALLDNLSRNLFNMSGDEFAAAYRSNKIPHEGSALDVAAIVGTVDRLRARDERSAIKMKSEAELVAVDISAGHGLVSLEYARGLVEEIRRLRARYLNDEEVRLAMVAFDVYAECDVELTEAETKLRDRLREMVKP